MKEGSYDKGELVSLRVRIQNMRFKLMKAEETSATLYENFATGLLDEQEYQMLREHYGRKEKLETGIREAQPRKRVVEKSIEEFLEIRSLKNIWMSVLFNQKMIDELVEKIISVEKEMIEIPNEMLRCVPEDNGNIGVMIYEAGIFLRLSLADGDLGKNNKDGAIVLKTRVDLQNFVEYR